MPSEAEVRADTSKILSNLMGQKIILPVTDQRCIKCGSVNNLIQYLAAESPDAIVKCPLAGTEHFHRTCNRCGYEWFSDDVLEKDVQ